MLSPKKHLMISALVGVCLLVLGYANRPEILAPIHWGERPLVWSDFPTIDHIVGNYDAKVYSDIQFEGDRDEETLRIFARMEPNRSGRVASDTSDGKQLLIHEQQHFNITEYWTRIFRKEAIDIGKAALTNDDLQRLGKKYREEIARMQIQYDTESEHNVNSLKQRHWELKVAGLLRETDYYTEEDLYTYQAFTGGDTQWYRDIYYTLKGDLLNTIPENNKNSKYGEVYNIERKEDSIVLKFYRNGKPEKDDYFEAPVIVLTQPSINVKEVHLFDVDGNYLKDAEYTIVKNVFDEAGNISVQYYKENGEKASKKGICRIERRWDEKEKTLYDSYFNLEDKPIKKLRAYHELRKLDSKNRTETLSYYDAKDRPILDEDFVFKYDYKYNENNLVTALKQYNTDEELAFHKELYHRTYEYDARGQIKRVTALDKKGSKTSGPFGVCSHEYIYDRYGNNTDYKKYNYRNIAVLGNEDFHQSVNIFDSLGRMTFNAKYMPGYVLQFGSAREGATIYEHLNDSIVRSYNIDAYGQEYNDDNGIHIVESTYNDKQLIVKENYYDMEGCWAKTPDGITIYEYEYDDRKNMLTSSAFDSLNNPRAWEEDVAITRWEYDDQNNKTKTTYFNMEGQLANAVQEVTYNVYKYNKDGALTERTNFNKAMQPSAFNGVFLSKMLVNRFGKDSIMELYDTDKRLLKGVCITKYRYNEYGNLLSESYWDRNNRPIMDSLGFHKVEYQMDAYQRSTGEIYYGVHGEKINNADGYAINHRRLTKSGFMQTELYYDRYENPVLGPEGYHKLEYFWNDADEVVRVSTYGTDLELINNEEGIADYVYKKNEAGMTERLTMYDREGALTEDSEGVAEYFYTPSLNGLYYLEKKLNAAGEEITEEVFEESSEENIE